MRITVLGTGYVGLVAGSCFSDSGNQVICVDVNPEKIAVLNRGEVPIFEPGLDEIIQRNQKAKRLQFTTDVEGAIGQAELIVVAVGTPSTEAGSVDLTFLLRAIEMVRDHVQRPGWVVIKSTVPVGTAQRVQELLKEARYPLEVVSNPEFLKEGTAVNDFLKPERVVIGTSSERAREVMRDLYAPFVRSGNPILFMNNPSAELSKYAANGFLAMKISFINEIAELSEQLGAEVHDIRQVLITDSRIGNKFLYPGCGYGGSCFPKDVKALIAMGDACGVPQTLISAVHQVNDRQKKVLYQKMLRHFGGDLKKKTLAIWGLSFKPMTDDMREAPSVSLIEQLLEAGANVRAYDPVARSEAERLFEDKITLFENAYEAVQGADALAILTEWNEFRKPDFGLLKDQLKKPVIFDGRNIYSPQSMQREQFTYYCIGKPDAS